MSLDGGDTAFGMGAMGLFTLPGRPRADSAPQEPVRPTPAFLAGMDALLDPTGALYWPARRTLVVSDLHLETGSSYARTGQMLPPYDTAVTLGRLADALGRYRPETLISLGDSFHDRGGPERLCAADRERLTALSAGRHVVWVTGNHDGECASVLSGTVCAEWTVGAVTFRHVPSEAAFDGFEVAGHLHPAARLLLKGRSLRRRCFIGCGRRLVMPAFGCLTGGLSVADEAFVMLWEDLRAPSIHMIGERRVYSVAPTAAAGDG